MNTRQNCGPAVARLRLAPLIAMCIGFWPPAALGQARQPEGTRNRDRVVSLDVDVLQATLIQIDLPDELELTPTHPDDVDAHRPPRSQPAPITGRHWRNGIRLGASVRPIRFRALKNIALGYGTTFFIWGDRIDTGFRTGTWLERRPYAYFICGSPFLPLQRTCEEAYTYSVVDSIAPFQDLRASYRVTVVADPNGDPNHWWGQRVDIEAGVKYSIKRVAVRQGWDRYNQDEVYRRSEGRGEALVPWGQLSIQYDAVSIFFGGDVETTELRFDGISETGALRGMSLKYGVAVSF